MASIRDRLRNDGVTIYWQVSYRVVSNGKTIQATQVFGGDEATARAFKAALELKRNGFPVWTPEEVEAQFGFAPRQERGRVADGSVTVAGYVKDYWQRRQRGLIPGEKPLASGTVATYLRKLDTEIEPVIGHTPLQYLTRLDLQRLIHELQGAAPKRKSSRRKAIRSRRKPSSTNSLF